MLFFAKKLKKNHFTLDKKDKKAQYSPVPRTKKHIMVKEILINVPVAAYGDLATAAALAGMDVNTWLARKLAGVPKAADVAPSSAPEAAEDAPLAPANTCTLDAFAESQNATA